MGELELNALPACDADARAAVADRGARVLRPKGALRRLDELAVWLAGWQRNPRPAVTRPAALIFAADHGVATEAVSAYPASVTAEVVAALRAGVATASVMARALDVRLSVVDVGVGHPTGNIVDEDALTPGRFAACWHAGTDAVDALDADLLALGEVGIGNTTAASAVASALFGGPVAQWVGRGTGLDDAGLAGKVAVVARAVERLGPIPPPLEALRRLGGGELVALAGAVVAARRRSLPVLLDGFVVGAAVATLERACPGALAHCLASHRSAEPGHARLLERLGMEPLLELDMRLGEASGALAAIPLVRLAAAAVTDVATFEEWDAARVSSR